MSNSYDWKELATELRVFTIWAISSLIDSAFIALWVFVQWLGEKVIANLELSGVDRLVLSVFQVIFAISTLAPVIIYICVDISVMIFRARRRIQREIELSKTHGSDSI